MTKREEFERNSGWCEEGQTYCSVSEKAYKQGREDGFQAGKEDVLMSITMMMMRKGYKFPLNADGESMTLKETGEYILEAVNNGNAEFVMGAEE